MFSFIIATIILATVFTAEGLVTSIIGAAASYGLTQFLKNKINLQGGAAALLAFAVSALVGFAAYAGSVYLNGGQLTGEMIVQNATQIFTLTTLAYKVWWKNDA